MGEQEDLTGWVEGAKGGADWALTGLYRQLQPALLGFLSGLVPGEAEDLAAETWIDAAGALASFDGDGADFRRLLFTIARRRAIDHGRRRRRRRTEPADVDHLPMLVSDPVADTSEEVADLDAAQQAIKRIFALLPRPQAEVVVLRVVGNLSVTEVAQILGRTPATVSVLQARGLRRLAARIGHRSRWEREIQPPLRNLQDPGAPGRWNG